MSRVNLAEVLVAYGIEAELDEGDLITDVPILAKVHQPDGATAINMAGPRVIDDQQPAPQCPICHSQGATWAVCSRCVATVDSRLAELVDLHVLAAVATTPALAKGRGPQGPRPSGGSHEPALEVNVDAFDLALGEALLSTDDSLEEPPWMGLETWERDWREQLAEHLGALAPYGEASAQRKSTLIGCIGWLRAQWPLTATVHPAADEFARDVARMWSWARRSLRADGMNERDAPAFVIACPSSVSGRYCNHRLEVYAQVVEDRQEPLAVHLNCPTCGSHWDLRGLITAARAQGLPVWATSSQAADALRVSVRTVYRMAARGDIERRGRLFNVGSRDDGSGQRCGRG